MNSSRELRFTLGYCLVTLFAVLGSIEANSAAPSEEDKCQRMLDNLRDLKISDRDCKLVYDSGEPRVNCTVYLNVQAPLDGNEPEDTETKLDFGVNMDYKLELVLGPKTNLTDPKSDEQLRCVFVKSVSFQRVDGKDGRQRATISLASSIFSVVFNAQNINEGVDLWEQVVIGIASIPKHCQLVPRKNHLPCPINIRVSTQPIMPGTPEDVYSGLMDFNVTAFGYSHLSGIYGYTGNEDVSYIRTFPDKTKVGKGLLKWLPGEHITSMLLSKNRWKTLNNAEFPKVPKLQYLDLSGNTFQVFDSDVLNETKLLKELNFSESGLIKIPTFISEQSDLELLNLGGNKLKYIHNASEENIPKFIHNLIHIKKLNISGYLIVYFSNITLPKLPELTELDISKCEIVNMEEDSFLFQPALVRIDLSSNRLNSLPKRIFANLKHLQHVNLANNKITNGQGLVFYYHKTGEQFGIQTLDFSSNSLGSTANLIADNSQIKFIDLRENAVRLIEGVSFQNVETVDLSSNFIDEISYASTKILSQLKSLNLTNNQFSCDSCILRDFQNWLNKTGREKLTEDVESLPCATPPALRLENIKVIDARYNEDLCRGPDLPVVLGSTFTSIGLIAALLGGVLYIYRFEASYVLHLLRVRSRAVKGEGKPDSECIYDAFVSYSGRDRNWVLRVLQPELEESDQKYQLCLHDRNFALGAVITTNIVESIDKSRKTILILSENFVDSQWCRWEMEMANHKLFNDSCEFLVLIELERLDRKNLPRHLRFLMDTRTYLELPTENTPLVSHADFDSSTNTQLMVKGNVAPTEPELQVFWKRLREALGDSLYTREKKALKEAELKVKQSKRRDLDTTVTRFSALERSQTEL